MNTLTLKIPETLDAALQAASVRRHMSKSAVVREALEKVLAAELRQTGPAANWVDRWRGVLSGKQSAASDDARVAHIMSKHLR
ncbi:MAG: ribbon-helix-helix protein, CopG family [Rhodocyclaceae bacterium]|nr:ribbon-helix-helix protein, CopG family [Rhodocyclaceae bacterium]